MTDYVSRIADAGLAVTWRTVRVGFDGPSKRGPVLTLDDVVAYADSRAADSLDVAAEILLAATSGEDEDVRTALHRVAGGTARDLEWELRKWRLVLLEEHLEHLPQDPLDGLIALTDFWETFDYPDDSPHVVQGRGNDVTPTEYFTEENLRRAMIAHREWIECERGMLRGR